MFSPGSSGQVNTRPVLFKVSWPEHTSPKCLSCRAAYDCGTKTGLGGGGAATCGCAGTAGVRPGRFSCGVAGLCGAMTAGAWLCGTGCGWIEGVGREKGFPGAGFGFAPPVARELPKSVLEPTSSFPGEGLLKYPRITAAIGIHRKTRKSIRTQFRVQPRVQARPEARFQPWGHQTLLGLVDGTWPCWPWERFSKRLIKMAIGEFHANGDRDEVTARLAGV